MISTRRMLALVFVTVVGVGLVSTRWLDGQQAVVLSANAFFFAYLALALADLGSLDRKGIQKVGSVVLIPSLLLVIVVLATVVCSITALFMLINAEKHHSIAWLLFALLAVPLGWATVHTMMALHYAHRYWRPGPVPVGHGLDFPGDESPDGWDFMYFSFTIGMAAQTADVSITDKPMRRIALIHSAMSYFFNAVLVAAAVNLAVAVT